MFEHDEITIEELADLHPSTYTLVDVRDDISFQYGTIPGAVQIPDLIKKAEDGTLDIDNETLAMLDILIIGYHKMIKTDFANFFGKTKKDAEQQAAYDALKKQAR